MQACPASFAHAAIHAVTLGGAGSTRRAGDGTGNGAGTQEADAGDDLRRDARRIEDDQRAVRDHGRELAVVHAVQEST